MSSVEQSIKNISTTALDAVQAVANFFGLGDVLKNAIQRSTTNITPEAAAVQLAALMSKSTTNYNHSMAEIEDKLSSLNGIVGSPTIKSILDKARAKVLAQKTKVQSNYDKATAAYNVGSAASSAMSTQTLGQVINDGDKYSKSVETSLQQMNEANNSNATEGGNN